MDFFATLLSPIAVSLAVIVIAVSFFRRKNEKCPPVAGSVIHQLMNAPRIHHYMTKLASKYRTYRMLDLFKYAVYTVDPANIEYVLKTNFSNYGKGEYLHSIISDVLGDCLFGVDGEKLQHQRKAGSTQLATKPLRDFSSEIFKTKAVKLASRIYKAVPCSEALDIQDLLMKSTFDSILQILLGIDIDTLCGTNEEVTQFSNSVDELNEAVLFRIADIFWKIKRFLNIGREAEIIKNVKVVDQFMYKLINNKIETVHSFEDDLSLKKRDFISRLLETKVTDRKYLRDILFFFLNAGKDTTAGALSWFVYMMCKHRQVQERIAQEIKEATNLKTISSFDELVANLTEEALYKMHYLQAALTETLRIYPIVPMNARVCFADDTWPDGNHVKRGELVVYQPYSMGRMKFLWGEDAEEFRPDRWFDENGIFRGHESPFKFTAFSAGPRICLGKEYAYMQMKIFAAVLLGSYIFKMSDEKKEVNYKTMFTLHIDGGLYVHASPRFEQAGHLN